MDTVLKVCKKEIIPTPQKIIYSHFIEKGIQELEKKLKNIPSLPSHLLRWISLKIIDGEEDILTSIEKNFAISLIDNVEIKLTRTKILDTLREHHITGEGFKDCIVSTIMNESEIICKKVCTFENKNYSR